MKRLARVESFLKKHKDLVGFFVVAVICIVITIDGSFERVYTKAFRRASQEVESGYYQMTKGIGVEAENSNPSGHMSELKVVFFEFSEEVSDSLYLNLNTPKDRVIVELIVTSDTINMNGKKYEVLEKDFNMEESVLYVKAKEVQI